MPGHGEQEIPEVTTRGRRHMKRENLRPLSIILFGAAIGMCIFGAVRGEADAVLVKAAKICMECIGLG
jgi:hypothetical protein